MKKDILRKTYLEKRQALSSSKLKEASSQLVNNTIELIRQLKPKCIHCFLPIYSKGEIDTMPIIKYCWENNINVVVPVSNFENNTLKTAEFKPETKTKQTKNNITEPIEPVWKKTETIDIVVTPLLAFDSKGYRVGYGKGFYDKFLSKYFKINKKILTIGIAFSFQKHHNLPINSKDIKLDYVLTEKGFI